MEKIEFECPTCGEKNNLILMGHDMVEFDKKCQSCKADLEILKTNDDISVKSKNKVAKKEINVPSDYKKYKDSGFVYTDSTEIEKTKLLCLLLF